MVNETPRPVSEQDAAAAASPEPVVPGAAPGKVLTPEAIRALEEAEARRLAARDAAGGQNLPTEIGGRDGEDPTRYGDYEKKGIAVDF
jgi:hypothetical protein